MEFITSPLPVPYPEATSAQEARVAAIRRGEIGESVWFLEHPSLYTAGTSAKITDLLNPQFPVFEAGRGGQYTYHGPGQRVAYVMVDLQKRGGDVRKYVWSLEEWVIETLKMFKIDSKRIPNRIGIWVNDKKIAAIGVRIRSGVTYHGMALNVNPDLSHYNGIIPCGIADAGITSMHALGKKNHQDEIDAVLKKKFVEIFA